MPAVPLRVAVVGTGPSGLLASEALLAAGVPVEIDLIERLPVPFGLVRHGVAPDHLATKRVAAEFAAILADPAVAFFGNVELGRDVTLEDLVASHDAVVLATGASDDRPLDIPGAGLPGVFGSAAFVGWYNGHPDRREPAPPLDHTAAVVIGAGNVALDVARILARSPSELEGTDIDRGALAALSASAVTDIHVIARRGPADARFTHVELKEMGGLTDAKVSVKSVDLPPPEAVLERVAKRNVTIFRDFAARPGRAARKRVHFHFGATPVRLAGEARVTEARFALRDGSTLSLACGLVVSAIGFRGEPTVGMTPRVHPVGWCLTGPRGVIGTCKPAAVSAAASILADGPVGDGRTGRDALRAKLAAAGVGVVDGAGWLRIEAAERSPGGSGKLADWGSLLGAARGGVTIFPVPGTGHLRCPTANA